MLNSILLSDLVAKGYVTVQKHPKADLYIYNYSPLTQFERLWNEITLACRGLILDKAGNVVARPFRKFFNLEEHKAEEIPNESFEVYEKLDGSLGILYPLDNQYYMASRGSFDSKQALRATKLLHEKYSRTFTLLQPDKTYLFEIIYPENRIVVDYGAKEDLVLLAVIDNVTGFDEPLPSIGFPLVKKHNGLTSLHSLKELHQANREGFVIKFTSGLRVKVKFDEYVRLHRILTGISSKNIWEYLATQQSFEHILEKVPDEFYDWVRKTVADLETAYAEIENYCKIHFKVLATRKETALYFQSLQYTGVLFAMLDNKNYAPMIWKMIKPTFEKPFSSVGGEDIA